MKKIACMSLSIFLVLSFFGCSSWLPSSKTDAKAQWGTFEETKNAFDKIVLHKTFVKNLKELGFDPFENPNITLLTYLDVVQRFLPNSAIGKKDLDEDILGCISAKESCKAYEIKLKKVHQDRFGNVFADLFSFRRRTRVTGWEFKALIVLKDDLVIHKIWGGNPRMDMIIDHKKPLGPLQTLEDVIWDVVNF